MKIMLTDCNGMYLKSIEEKNKSFPGMINKFNFTENKSEALKVTLHELIELINKYHYLNKLNKTF